MLVVQVVLDGDWVLACSSDAGILTTNLRWCLDVRSHLHC